MKWANDQLLEGWAPMNCVKEKRVTCNDKSLGVWDEKSYAKNRHQKKTPLEKPNIFQKGWNHQLDYIYLPSKDHVKIHWGIQHCDRGSRGSDHVAGETFIISPGGGTCLGGGFINVFGVHPEPWGNDTIWAIFFKGVGSTTNDRFVF